MTDITSINKSISEMSDNELFDRIKQLRNARRIPTVIPRHSKKAKSKKTAASADDLLAKMTPEQIAKLAAQLEEQL